MADDNKHKAERRPFDPDEFRNHLTTVTEDGKVRYIIPTKPKGKYFTKRAWVAVFYYALFFVLPFVFVKGRPLFLFNFPEGKFILFGYAFWPQDFLIFGLIMLAALLFIALFTMAFGRIFCGWICPQTIFMELLFRRIDYLVLGDAPRQKMLAKAPLKGEKLGKYGLRYTLYFILSFLISNTFLAYIIGVDELFKIATEPVGQHLGGFIAIIVFTLTFFCVYVFLREQVCTNICPYGRLQGVLLDKDSIVVAYDYKRGEPRSKYKKGDQGDLGDCIDCHQCVNVCPTGIDIRNGTQLECVNCTACIDACNFIMEKVNRPQGLIRYDSEHNIAEGKPFRFTTRLKVYATVLLVLLISISVMLITRKDVGGNIMRTAGMLYQERGTDSVSNLYNIKLINKTMQDIELDLKLEGVPGIVEFVGKTKLVIKAEEQATGTFFVVLPRQFIKARKQKLEIGLYQSGIQVSSMSTTFLGPIKRSAE